MKYLHISHIAMIMCFVLVILLKTAIGFLIDLHMCGGASPVGCKYRFTFTALRVCCIKPSVDFHVGLNENAN